MVPGPKHVLEGWGMGVEAACLCPRTIETGSQELEDGV